MKKQIKALITSISLFCISILLFSTCNNNSQKVSKDSNKNEKVIFLGNSSDSCMHKTYYENGYLKIEEIRVNDTLEGTRKIYYKNGQIKKTTQFKNGKANGILRVYDIDGFLKREYLYLKDSQIVANVRSRSDSTIQNVRLNVDNKESFIIDTTINRMNTKNFNKIKYKYNISHRDTITNRDTLDIIVSSNVDKNEYIQLIFGEFNSNFEPTKEENLINIRSNKGRIAFSTLNYNIGDNLLVGVFIKSNGDSSTRRIFYTTFYVRPK